MMHRAMKAARGAVVFGATLVLGGALFASPLPQDSQQPSADNSKMNQGDAGAGAVTADQQKMNSSDREMTKNIRLAIVKDKYLSTYAHNIKIITQDGKVTLKGPVRSDAERSTLEAKAAAIAGADNVSSQVTVTSPKQ
jgi:hyperosmotically inducible periplasmic protein